MRKIELSITALATSDNQPNSFVVVLKEEQGNRRLPIVIGGFEAQAIAIALEKIQPTRPLTHDLFKNVLDALDVTLEEVIVSDLKSGVFYATLVCRRPDGKTLEMDSRTSDAIAMAVRYACPIFAYDFVLDEAGITLESDQEIPVASEKTLPLKQQSIEELEKLLEEALNKEDYERAAELRDEIKRREIEGGESFS